MAYCGYITTLKNLRAHPNADRLQLAECFGNTVCVSLDYKVDMVGVYFPCDGQLSVEFCEKNNLVRKKDDAGNNIGGYLDPDKRNITAIRLRGEKSDGLFLPLSCLNYCYIDFNAGLYLKVGDTIDVVNGHDICQKYIPRKSNHTQPEGGNHTRKKKVPVAPLFTEHADTEQLAYNLNAFKPGDQIEITLKMHGTSQRTGYLPTLQGYACAIPWARWVYKHINPETKNKFAKKLLDAAMKYVNPVYDWGYVSGTRRVVLENYEGGFYGNNEFREQHSKTFEGKLLKGEIVYYEVVGFTDNGTPIMGSCPNKRTNDPEFIKHYGETTTFSYGCNPQGWEVVDDFADWIPQSDIYVYRMTMTNEDGDVVEYTPDYMRYRCEQMGVKCVPVFWKGYIPENCGSSDDDTITPGEWVANKAEQYYDGPDPVGRTHVREGVVVRIINRPKFCAYKHKNFSFKCLEGIVKASADAPDMEEEQENV